MYSSLKRINQKYGPSFLILIILLLLSFGDNKKTVQEAKVLPPKLPGAWPSSSPEQISVTLGRMADKYGPIFTIMFGMQQTLVLTQQKNALPQRITFFKVVQRIYLQKSWDTIMPCLG